MNPVTEIIRANGADATGYPRGVTWFLDCGCTWSDLVQDDSDAERARVRDGLRDWWVKHRCPISNPVKGVIKAVLEDGYIVKMDCGCRAFLPTKDVLRVSLDITPNYSLSRFSDIPMEFWTRAVFRLLGNSCVCP